MEFALITLEKITEMFLIMAVGILAFHVKIIDGPTNKRLSNILMNIIAPAMLFMSFQIEFKTEQLQRLLVSAGLAALTLAVSIVLAQFIIPSGKHGNTEIERNSIIYSNCGFMGIPLVNGLLGKEGVFFLTAYIAVFNMFVWTHGLSLMSGETGSIRMVLKKFIQPSVIGIILGIICYVLRIRLPEVLANPLNMVGDMNTPMAMIVAGCTLAESDLLGALKQPRTYWLSALKLLVMPLITMGILHVLNADHMIALTILAAASSPTAAMITLFALQNNKDGNYASELFTITTMFSLVTIPVMMVLGSFIF